MNKKLSLTFLAAAMMLVACHQQEPKQESFQPLPIHKVQGRSCFEITANDTIPIVDGIHLDVENQFDIAWPDLDGFEPQVRRELIRMAFNDSTSATLQEAARRFLAPTWVEDDDLFSNSLSAKHRKIDSVEIYPYNYATVHGEVRQDGNLLHFTVNDEFNVAYAAHGIYGYRSLIVDRSTGRIVRLSDLMDTTDIGLLLIRALEEVPSNRANGNTITSLDGQYQSRLPMPDGFIIDSTRSTLTAFYDLYSVQSYAFGMFFVDMSLPWLATNATLTPYGKTIFATKETL